MVISVNHSARSGGIIDIFSIFFNMKVCCEFSLKSPHPGDSDEYTIISIKKKIQEMTYISIMLTVRSCIRCVICMYVQIIFEQNIV